MKNKARALLNRTETLGGAAICVLTGIFTLILTLTAFLFTTGMEIVESGMGMDSTVNRIFDHQESVVYYSDPFVGNLIFLAVSVVGCRLLLPLVSKLRLRYEAVTVAVWTLAIGLVWVFSSQVKPTYDSAYVAESALAFAQGDFSDLKGEYLNEYPFQLGYIFLCELILRGAILLGNAPDTFLILQAANVCFLALAYVGLLALSSLLFKDRRARHLTFLLLLFCAVSFATFGGFGSSPGSSSPGFCGSVTMTRLFSTSSALARLFTRTRTVTSFVPLAGIVSPLHVIVFPITRALSL